MQGHNAQKTSFSGTSIIGEILFLEVPLTFGVLMGGLGYVVKQIGHATLTIALPNGQKEQYLITLPRLVIAGLLMGSPYIELSETSYIASSTGFLCTVSDNKIMIGFT